MNRRKVIFLAWMASLLFFTVAWVDKNGNFKTSAKVVLGIDKVEQNLNLFNNKRVGLITNQTGVNSSLVSAIEIFKAKTNLKALFAPRYGVRDSVGVGRKAVSYIDKDTGLTVYCLCRDGLNIEPTADMLKNVDVLVYDVQNAGVRFCDITTIVYAMKACKKYNKTFVVLDRPNPLSGSVAEGGMLQPDYFSLFGMYSIPIRFGLTAGELSRYLNDKMNIKCDLSIVSMSGWSRDMYWKDTDIQWRQPNINISTAETALAYAGICLC